MNNNEIRWHFFDRFNLCEVLFGEHSEKSIGKPSLRSYDFKADQIAIAFHEARSDSRYSPPALIVVDDENASETFSWLKVYSPETSPLSQFARVITLSDWDRFNAKINTSKFSGHRLDRWASVIVGEALAQGDTDIELPNLPLSRASACFTTTLARATTIHGTDDVARICTERLRLLESEPRFVRRPVSVNDLLPIWAIAGMNIDEAPSIEEAAHVVMQGVTIYNSNLYNNPARTKFNIDAFPDLASDSIEDRVVAFKRLSNLLINSVGRELDIGTSSAIIAAAAFLVGRGTTHEFLLRRTSKLFPTATVWFGLIAALAGPTSWDPSWARAVKGIERQIRTKFDWSESAGSDLCWAEFNWLARTHNGLDVFSNLPKIMSKVLSVEILPGATCQLRLSGAGTSEQQEARFSQNTNAREIELQGALNQFLALATKTKKLLEENPHNFQQSLIDENGDEIKEIKSKKVKRNTN